MPGNLGTCFFVCSICGISLLRVHFAFPASRGLLQKQRHSPADSHSPAPPGESGFLSAFLFPRRSPFHCFSGGIELPRLFLFPPQTAVPLLLRGNSASSPIPLSPANRYFPASPGESGFLPPPPFPLKLPFLCSSGGIELP